MAKPSVAGREIPICVRGWHLSSPELGWRIRERRGAGGHCGKRGRLPGSAGRRGGHEGGQGQLADLLPMAEEPGS